MRYSVFILPLGEIDDDVLEHVVSAIQAAFRVDVKQLKARPTPFFAYSDYRHQFSAPAILRRIAGLAEHDNAKILAVTPYDLFAPKTTFVFGEAQMPGSAAVISLYRLMDQERGKYLARAGKEAIHEVGHTFGLEHCADKSCVMMFSHNIIDADQKPQTFCEKDTRQLDLVLHTEKD